MAVGLRQIMAEREQALYHFQAEILQHPIDAVTPGLAWLRVRIGTVFRSDAPLRPDDQIELGVQVCRAADTVPPGAPYVELEALAGTRFVEVFAGGEPPRLSCIPSGLLPIERLSLTPAAAVKSTPTHAGRRGRWWKFWS